MSREQRLREIEEEISEIAEIERQYEDIIRKMDYPDGSLLESLRNAVTRTFPGMRFGTRQGALMGIERCKRQREALERERDSIGY